MIPQGAIWVRMPRFIGDAVMIAQSLQPFRDRGIPLVAWGPEPVMDLFRGSNFVQAVQADDPRRKGALDQARLLRQYGARGLLNFCRSQRGLLAAWIARVPSRLGWREGGGWLLASHSLPFRGPGHQVDRYAALLAQAFPELPSRPSEPFRPREAARVEAVRLLEAQGLRGPLAVIALGAAADIKRVGSRVWAGLAPLLEARGLDLLILGGPLSLDRRQAEELRNLLPAARILCGETSLATSAALLERAAVCFANDSALAHLSAACQRPTIVAFGPTDPGRTMPVGPRVTSVRHPSLDCLACGSFNCRRGDHACMQSLDPVLFLEQADRFLPAISPACQAGGRP